MKRLAVLLLSVAFVLIGAIVLGAHDASAAELIALTRSGPKERCIDLVIVAEGYLASDQQRFATDAAKIADGVLSYGPYAMMKGLVNVHGLFVASKQAGADHPSAARYVDTTFHATYGTGGIARLLTADDGKVLAAVTDAFADWDLAVVLVNDSEYGGSGGPVPVVSTNALSIGILRHELAHRVGGVADEYSDPYPGKAVTDSEPNVALKAHLKPLKWRLWVTPGTPIPTPVSAKTGDFAPIGAYEGARYQAIGMFRPAPTCIMRELTADFCPVCFEAVSTGMAKAVVAVQGGLPASDEVLCTADGCPMLRVEVAAVDGITVRWLVDGKTRKSSAERHFDPGKLQPGTHTAVAQVFHTGDHLRNEPQGIPIGSRQWSLKLGPSVDAGGTNDAGAGAVASDTEQALARAARAVRPTVSAGCQVGAPIRGTHGVFWLGLMVLLLARRSRRCRSA